VRCARSRNLDHTQACWVQAGKIGTCSSCSIYTISPLGHPETILPVTEFHLRWAAIRWYSLQILSFLTVSRKYLRCRSPLPGRNLGPARKRSETHVSKGRLPFLSNRLHQNPRKQKLGACSISIYLGTLRSIYLSIYLSTYLSTYLPIYLSIYVSKGQTRRSIREILRLRA
jgi:hypothetical protein